MDKDNFHNKLDGTFESIKSYVNLKTELFKIIIFERVARVLTKLFTLIILIFLLFFVMLFLSLAFVHWFEENGGLVTHGYLIVAISYLIVGIIFFLARKKIFFNPIIKGFSETALEDDEELFKSGNKDKMKNEKD